MPQPQRRNLSPEQLPGKFCCPGPRPKAPLPKENCGQSWSSALRNLNPYIRPKRSNSLQCPEKELEVEQRRFSSSKNIFFYAKENESSLRSQVACLQRHNQTGNGNGNFQPCSGIPRRDNPIKQYHYTYPPYLYTPDHQVLTKRSVKSMILNNNYPSHYRWDEDPCLLRPNSPSHPCPHNTRNSSHSDIDEGSCFVVGAPLELQRNVSLEEYHEIDNKTEENEYSYAGDDILSPAEVIKAQADLGQESDCYGGSLNSDNIYEEIPEEWEAFKAKNRKSLVEEVFDEYARIRARQVHSATNPSIKISSSTEGSIVTFDFVPPDHAASPDSWLTTSPCDNSSDGFYDPVEFRGRSNSERKPPSLKERSEKVKSCIVSGKPPIPKLSRCESMDIKDVNKSCERISIKRPRNGSEVRSKSASGRGDQKEVKKENLIRDHLRSSGRGIKLKLDGMKEKLEQSTKLILSKAKKGEYMFPFVLL